MTAIALPFDGATFDPQFDLERLHGQLKRVYTLMSDGQWRTLTEIQNVVGGSESGCSARLRDLRKSKWGGFEVERRRRGEPSGGIFEYRLVL